MKFSTQFKKSFSYTWYLYLLAIVLPTIAFPLSFSFMHRAKQHETLSIFVPSSLKNDKGDEFLLEKFKDSGVRKTEFVTFDPEVSIYNFYQKLTVVAYNTCDLIVLPEETVEKALVNTAAIELTNEIKNMCLITSENIKSVNEIEYGVELPKNTPLAEFANLKEETNYYAFLNAKSWNIGEYSTSKVHTENAFKLMQYFLGK